MPLAHGTTNALADHQEVDRMSSFRLPRLQRRLTTIATLASLGLAPSLLGACNGHSSSTPAAQRVTGQSDFVSAPQLGGSGSSASFGATNAGGGAPSSGTATPAPTAGSS